MEELKSSFADSIAQLLKFRKSLGFDANFHFQTLKRFDAFATAKHPNDCELTRSLVEEFVFHERVARRRGIREKLHAIRNLGMYISSTGGRAYVVPMSMIPKQRKFNPHVFADHELAALFREIDEMAVGKSFDPMVYAFAPVAFRLIYTCGLRPGEGYGLQRRNVDLATGEIRIEKTKFKKERIVVMSDDMHRLLSAYLKYAQIRVPNSDFVFCDSHGRRCKNYVFERFFERAWRRANGDAGSTAPAHVRVYDLRHRFASKALCGWTAEGVDLFSRLPFLRAYMGHASISSTMYYVHLLPKAILASPSINWNKLNSILPKD